MGVSERCGKPPYSVASQPYIDPSSSQAAFVCAIICSILGILGNIITTIVLLGDKSLRRHSTTPFLLSLAVSDLMFSTIYLPLLAVRFHYREEILDHIGYGTCKLFPFFLYANIIISAYSMALVALNRFTGIYYPHLVPSLFTPVKSYLMVAGVWAFAGGLLALPLTETWGQMGYEPATFSCTIVPKNGKTPDTFLVVVGIALPCTIMITCYCLILARVRQTGRAMRDVITEEDEVLSRELSVRKMTLRREKQLTKTLVMICAGFLLCFLPSSLIILFDPMPPCWQNPELHVAGFIIFWCSAFINPIIYTLSNKTYRKSFVYFIKKFVFCQKEDEQVSTWYETGPPQQTESMMMTSSVKSSIRSGKRVRVMLEEEDKEEEELGHGGDVPM